MEPPDKRNAGWLASHIATRTATGFQLSSNGSTSRIRPTGFPVHIGNPCRYEKPEHSPAHLCASAPSSRSFASFAGAASPCPSAFGNAANQRTSKDDPRPGRPIERAFRSASVPSQLGGFTLRRPAFLRHRGKILPGTRSIAATAQDGGRFESSALPPSQTPQFSANFPELSGFVRPFFPSSRSPKPLLRAKRKGGGICFDLSSGVLGNQLRDSLNDPARQTGFSYLRGYFPGSNDRQDSGLSPDWSRARIAGGFPRARQISPSKLRRFVPMRNGASVGSVLKSPAIIVTMFALPE